MAQYTYAAAASAKKQAREGYDVLRLVHPPIDQINEDFLCAICQSKCLFPQNQWLRLC